MTEFVVRMANRPGMLAKLTETLAEVGVNIEALAAFGYDDTGVVRLVVDNAPAARSALREAGLAHDEHQILTTYLRHQPGQLASVARKLADAGVNVDALYVLHTNSEGIDLAISVDEPELASSYLSSR